MHVPSYSSTIIWMTIHLKYAQWLLHSFMHFYSLSKLTSRSSWYQLHKCYDNLYNTNSIPMCLLRPPTPFICTCYIHLIHSYVLIYPPTLFMLFPLNNLILLAISTYSFIMYLLWPHAHSIHTCYIHLTIPHVLAISTLPFHMYLLYPAITFICTCYIHFMHVLVSSYSICGGYIQHLLFVIIRNYCKQIYFICSMILNVPLNAMSDVIILQ